MSDNKYLTKNEAREIFLETYAFYKDNQDKVWESLLEYRRLLGENEYI